MMISVDTIQNKLVTMQLSNKKGENPELSAHHHSTFGPLGPLPSSIREILALQTYLQSHQGQQLLHPTPQTISDTSVTSSGQVIDRKVTRRQHQHHHHHHLHHHQQQPNQSQLMKQKRFQQKIRDLDQHHLALKAFAGGLQPNVQIENLYRPSPSLVPLPLVVSPPAPMSPPEKPNNAAAAATAVAAVDIMMRHRSSPSLLSPQSENSIAASGSGAEASTTTKKGAARAARAVKAAKVAVDKPTKKYGCDLCYKSFDYKHVLQNHYRTHTGEKPYPCPACPKRFTRDHHLKTHMRLHTGEKPFVCKTCQKRFVQIANLRRHVRVHTGERPYRCRFADCSSKFSDSNQLKAHSMVHSDEKPFGCDDCGARFRRKHHHKNHKCNPNKRRRWAATKVSSGCVSDNDNNSITSASSSSFSAASPHSDAPSPASNVPSPASAVSNSSSSNVSLSSNNNNNNNNNNSSGIVADFNLSPLGTSGSISSNSIVKMEVDVCVNNNGYQHYNQWPQFSRHLPPLQEQPEDLSIKK